MFRNRVRRGNVRARQRVPDVRFVNNRIRALHLNAAPHWYDAAGGKRNRGIDVPNYIADTIYTRRVRFVILTETPPLVANISVANVFTALGWTLGATSFTQLFVRRITAYGPDTGSLILSPFICIGATSAKDRDFSDFGVPGSRRCCIAVEISPKDTATFTVAANVICAVTGSIPATQIIVDFHCEFSGTTTTALGYNLSDDPTFSDAELVEAPA